MCKARYLSQGIRAGKKLRGHLAQRTHFTDEESDPETRLDLPGLGRHQSHRCFADHIFLVLHRYRYNRYCAPHAAFQFPHRVFETTLQGKGVFISQFTGEETEAQRVKSFARGHKISAGAPQVHPSSGSRAASPILQALRNRSMKCAPRPHPRGKRQSLLEARGTGSVFCAAPPDPRHGHAPLHRPPLATSISLCWISVFFCAPLQVRLPNPSLEHRARHAANAQKIAVK